MTQLLKIWTILKHTPQIISIIAAIINFVGSEQVQKILEAIREALKKEAPPDALPTTEPERKRLVDRLFRRLAFTNLGMSEDAYAALISKQQEQDLA